MFKRLFDILFSGSVLICGCLPLLALYLLVRWKLGRPVFFRQERAGKDGHLFNMMKFRTMTEERDASGALLPDEERLTPFGSFLRKTSLDELPEFWDVLKGNMSVVGPRPLPTRYLARYTPEQARRHTVKPGITGWTQVSGRNGLSWDEKFRCDVWYVDHHSLLLDFKIILLTVWRVFRCEGISTPGYGTAPEFTGDAGTSDTPSANPQ
ncbi:MAG: sugar transferase [Puniceicoccales bacterium]|jgi:lipopolysaccharide/colanic/teichoic acid biosynthesis glycosyltransferase|nr:sugar transferase [Puniceicoccales bacterium]